MFLVESFKKSLFDLAWLKAHRMETRGAWVYFLSLCAVLALALTIFLSFVGYSTLSSAKNALTRWPNFTATLKNGALTVTGLTEPYRYQTATKDMLVVVDTAATTTPVLTDYLATGQSGILITRDQAEVYDGGSGQSRSELWSNLPDYTVTRSSLQNLLETQLKSPWLVAYAFLLLLVVYVVLAIGMFSTIVLAGILSWMVSFFLRRGWRFRELLVVGLFAVTLPTLITVLFSVLGLGVNGIFFLALLAFMLAVVMTNDSQVVPQASEE